MSSLISSAEKLSDWKSGVDAKVKALSLRIDAQAHNERQRAANRRQHDLAIAPLQKEVWPVLYLAQSSYYLLCSPMPTSRFTALVLSELRPSAVHRSPKRSQLMKTLCQWLARSHRLKSSIPSSSSAYTVKIPFFAWSPFTTTILVLLEKITLTCVGRKWETSSFLSLHTVRGITIGDVFCVDGFLVTHDTISVFNLPVLRFWYY